MRIAVASGKGGTGKSTVSANLAQSLSETQPVVLVDCDVEEPNLHLFFPSEDDRYPVTVDNPVVDGELCDGCGDCGRFCRYGAITVINGKHSFLPGLCHSCNGCAVVCPPKAITMVPREVGVVRVQEPSPTLILISGVLNGGEVQAPPVINSAKKRAEREALVIYDASPGIACPVIETLEGSDFCLLVTESTPFGLHDLELATGVTEEMGIPAGVVINRSDGRDELINDFCAQRGLPVLMTIPFDRHIAAVQNIGGLMALEISGWDVEFLKLYTDIVTMMEACE